MTRSRRDLKNLDNTAWLIALDHADGTTTFHLLPNADSPFDGAMHLSKAMGARWDKVDQWRSISLEDLLKDPHLYNHIRGELGL